MVTTEQLLAKIRDVPDFPEKGIIFKDITPLLQDGKVFGDTIQAMADRFRNQHIDAVTAIEARGYILGAPVAAALGVGFVPVRKVGKLPWHTNRIEYALEYGSATMEIHQDALSPGQRVLIVDDVLATGGTLAATIQLVENSGARVVAAVVLLELDFLSGREKLGGHEIFSLLRC